MSLSTHVLDTALGRPAADVPLALYEFRAGVGSGEWLQIGAGHTDVDGRCRTLLGGRTLMKTKYKLAVNTAAYFSAQKIAGLYPIVEIVFAVQDATEHFHIPLLLSPNGYTTYRGS